MATGALPFRGESTGVIFDGIMNRAPLSPIRLNPDMQPDLERIINRALEKDRELRYQSAAEMRSELMRLKRDTESGRFPVPAKAEAAIGVGTRWKVILPAAMRRLALAAGGYFYFHRTPKLTEKDTIVLADFTNTTGEALFDGTLRQGLSVQLAQSPFLSLVSEEGIHHTLRMMGHQASARLTPEIAREVCQRTSSTAALNGSIALIGTQYDLILSAVNCASGDLLASTEAQANDKSHVLDALGKVASEMRRKLGESLGTLQKYNTTLEQASTPSLEALQAYNFGQNTDDDAAQLAFNQRAIQLDPNFAMAYWAMVGPYQIIGESALSAENSRKAFALRAGVSEREKLHIEVYYYYHVVGDLMKARRGAEVGAQTYPRELCCSDLV